MNDKQSNQYRMHLAVQECLDTNLEKWNGIPIIVQMKNELDELIQRIEVKDSESSADSTTFTKQKELLRNTVTRKAVSMAGVLSSFAAITGDDEMADSMHLTESMLNKAKETDIENMVNPIIEMATNHVDDFIDYGVTAEQVTELQTSLDDFTARIGKPRVIRNQAFAAIKMIDALIDEARDLLNNKLDKLMLRFRYSDPEFYDAYTRARTIVDR